VRAHPRSDLQRAYLVWLLEITYAGRIYRWSSEPFSLSSDDADLRFDGDLGGVAFAETADRLTTSIAMSEISLEVVFPVDLAQQHRLGHRLQGALGELSSVVVERGVLPAYESRVVHLVGEVSQPQYGHPYRDQGWAAFTITGSPTEDTARFLSGTQRISAYTWSDADDEVVANYGQPYPIIIGTPGRYYEGGSQKLTGSTPAYAVEWDGAFLPHGADTLLIAGHHVDASQITLFAGEEAAVVLNVTDTTDNLGQPVATVDVSGQTEAIRTANSFLIAWGTAAGMTKAGLTNPYRVGSVLRRGGSVLRRGGDVIRWALSHSTLPVDHAAFAAAAPALNQLNFDSYIDDPDVSPWEWVRNLIGLLPISIRRGAGGLYPILHDVGETSPSAAIAITAGADFTRIGPIQVETESADQATEITVEYAPRADGDFAKTLTAGGAVDIAAGTVTTTAHSRVGHTNLGPRREVLSLPLVYDDATAASILRRRVRERSSVILTVPYEAGPSWGWLTVGQLVALTDADLYYTDQIAEISSKEWDGNRWQFVLLIVEDPARDTRA